MSGHSKWSTIKRAKGAADAKRSAMFGKLSKRISIAAREGNSGDINHNFKLRVEVEKAKAQSMPNDNIERAIKKGLGQGTGPTIEEITYEGYGPYGVALLIETATDNSNRTVQSIKHTLTKNGGSLGAMGSTAWQFETIGQIMVENNGSNMDDLELAAIEQGALDTENSSDGLIVTTEPAKTTAISEHLKSLGGSVVSSEIIRRSTQPNTISEEEETKINNLIEQLEDDDDVLAVYSSVK